MERVIFVEVLDRRGRVAERAAVDQLPFRIGRGYDCDLILDDPHVDALHAVIERNTARSCAFARPRSSSKRR
jgi:pSer/pThr/pTyr-binding forkhead associated (FHA) protein